MENLITAPVLPHVRKRLASISTVILDEIGLVGGKTLACISRRLSFILGKPQPFGSLGVVMLGDFTQVSHYSKQWHKFEHCILLIGIIVIAPSNWRYNA